MFKKIFFAIVFQGSAMLYAQTGILKVTVTDSIKKGVVEMAGVVVESGGITAGTGTTDEKGILVFKNLSPGKYNVKASFVGYAKKIISGVLVINNETTDLEVELSSTILKDLVIVDYKKPLVNINTSIKPTFDLDDITKSPLDPLALVANQGVQKKEGISPSFRGARSDANVIIIDGQAVTIGSAALPRMGVQQISVTLGGVPAMYGDGTGAFIEIETRSGLVNSKKSN